MLEIAKPKTIFYLFHTVRHLKPIQIYGRIWFHIFQPKPDYSERPGLRGMTGKWQAPIFKKRSLLKPWKFNLLNLERECTFPKDWHNNDLDKLWLYNLHYFHDLQSSDAKSKQEWHRQLMRNWINDNPPGWGIGWEPYPLSLRIVNWIKWFLNGEKGCSELLHSLAIQARYLFKRIEYHLQGNHLFTNAKALLFAGLFFHSDEAKKWFRTGFKIIDRELSVQILNDGGHFERSPMYHAILLEDMLDIFNIMQEYNISFPLLWKDKIASMGSWLKTMCHPDGEIALFNDAAFGVASSPEEIKRYACRLGWDLAFMKESSQPVVYLEFTGYIRCQNGNMTALLDVGAIGPDYLLAHAHADTLSFELSLYGKRVIVDSGTSCYGRSAERQRQRGTAAHNTVVVDDQNSSEVWGGFRVARRARPCDLDIEETRGRIRVACSHDGFLRLPGRVVHRREWIFEENSLLIIDRVSGKFSKAVSRFHFHPDIRLSLNSSGMDGTIIFSDGRKTHWQIQGGQATIAGTTYHPEFGVSLKNSCLEITFTGPQCTILFDWSNATFSGPG